LIAGVLALLVSSVIAAVACQVSPFARSQRAAPEVASTAIDARLTEAAVEALPPIAADNKDALCDELPTDEPTAPAGELEAPPQPKSTPKVSLIPSTLDHIARNCLVDRFANDRYMVENLQAKGIIPVSEEPMLPATPKPPAPDSPEFDGYVKSLVADWSDNPRSHVLDCAITLEPRDCEDCEHPTPLYTEFRYGIYLPKAYMLDPSSLKTALLLTPGGRGGRTRWFLEPEPYRFNKKNLSQGLSVQQKLDAHLESHPDRLSPIVISMDDPGFLYTNGTAQYMTEDLLNHVLATFLPGKARKDIAFGVDAISSGSKNAALAFVKEPYAFDTFGWMSTFCNERGLNPKNTFGPYGEGRPVLGVWRDRSERGELHMKFSIGKMDKYIECNRGLHSLFVSEGIIHKTHEPYLTECPVEVNANGKPVKAKAYDCKTVRSDMTEYPGVGHNFGVMKVAFDEHLYWHVEKLTDVARVRGL
jgi:hypothetical protein